MLFNQWVNFVVLSWICCFRFTLGASLHEYDSIHHGASSGRKNESQTTSNETCKAPGFDGTSHANHQCAIWLAPSTIPGAGIGIFAGKVIRRQNHVMQGGDLAIPIVDALVDLPDEYPFYLLNEYTWGGYDMYMSHMGHVDVSVISPGLGGAINSMADFNNVMELNPVYSVPHGLHRRSDPGAGAFTYYHSRKTRALSKIKPGDELFASYGDHWFIQRKSVLGPVPLEGDHAYVDSLYRKMKRIVNKQGNETDQPDGSRQNETQEKAAPQPTPCHSKKIADELWGDFVLGSPWDDSPTMAALPSTKEDYEALETKSLKKLKKPRLNRSLEWLQDNGVCGATMNMGISTIRQAGHGAFASWKLGQGTVLLPIPLIHTPYRVVLNLYDGNVRDTNDTRRGRKVRFMPPQLLLNYCMGHRDSTLLLTPYGPLFSLINHNQTLANVRLQWASPQRSQHNPALLNMTIAELAEIEHPQLAMELVALRDIEPGEEIFIDYGNEWEAAWQKHVDDWKPEEGADTYVSAFEMNQEIDHVFRTDLEQEENPYPSNLRIKFHYYFFDAAERRFWLKRHPKPFTKALDEWKEEYSGECRITSRHQTGRRTLYSIVVKSKEPPHEWVNLKNVPREALFFEDRPYSTDMFLKNAFRHDMRIPDELFPEKWKNIEAKKQ